MEIMWELTADPGIALQMSWPSFWSQQLQGALGAVDLLLWLKNAGGRVKV